MVRVVIGLSILLGLVGCTSDVPYPVDVYYICSTDVMSSLDEQGNEVYNAVLTQAEKEMLDQELDFMRDKDYQRCLGAYILPASTRSVDAARLFAPLGSAVV